MESHWKPVTFQWTLDEGIIKPQKLYESIVIIKWPGRNKFNSAAMGVKFTDFQELYLSPYAETDTYDLLMSSEVKLVSVNLTDDIEIFAKSALTGLHSGSIIEEIGHSHLNIQTNYAYLKSSQYVILGEIQEREKASPKKRGSFRLKIKEIHKTGLNSQLVNRGDNMALEAVVYASKIPAANNQQQVQKLIEKVRGYQYDIRRFSSSKRALSVCNYIDEFLDNPK